MDLAAKSGVLLGYRGAAGSARNVTVDAPCLILLSGDRLYISNPAHLAASVTVSIDGKSHRMQLPGDGTTVQDQF